VVQNSFKDRAYLDKVEAIFAKIGAELDLQEAWKPLEVGPI